MGFNNENTEAVERAYSMASYPAEGKEVMLNVRIATPPWDRNKNAWMDVNPGVASSYIFSKKPGDKVTISGPYGEFSFINHSEAEMPYVGGGAEMAPMRSHLYHLFRTLKTGRKVTFGMGVVRVVSFFMLTTFERWRKIFRTSVFTLLCPSLWRRTIGRSKTVWMQGDGFIGFVHQVVIDQYPNHHEEPEDIEVYFCGPPLMNMAVEKMAEDFGVPPENVRFDDFGG